MTVVPGRAAVEPPRGQRIRQTGLVAWVGHQIVDSRTRLAYTIVQAAADWSPWLLVLDGADFGAAAARGVDDA